MSKLCCEIMPEEEIETWVRSLPKLPTIEDAKVILNEAEIINPGTENQFIKGCMGNKYRDAVTVLELEYMQIKKLLEEKG